MRYMLKRYTNCLPEIIATMALAFVAVTSASAQSTPGPEADRFNIILHDSLTQADINHLVKALNENYGPIVQHLQVSSLPRITIQIWADEEHYQQAMEETLGMRFPGSRGYVTGDREMRLLYHRRLSAQKEAVHEFAHVVTLNMNPEFGNNPRWLWEAVAMYEAQEFRDPRDVDYMKEGKYPTLADLNEGFNTGRSIYDVGYTLVAYIVNDWGSDALINLIHSNGDIEGVLSVTEEAFEKGWHEFVESRYLNR